MAPEPPWSVPARAETQGVLLLPVPEPRRLGHQLRGVLGRLLGSGPVDPRRVRIESCVTALAPGSAAPGEPQAGPLDRTAQVESPYALHATARRVRVPPVLSRDSVLVDVPDQAPPSLPVVCRDPVLLRPPVFEPAAAVVVAPALRRRARVGQGVLRHGREGLCGLGPRTRREPLGLLRAAPGPPGLVLPRSPPVALPPRVVLEAARGIIGDPDVQQDSPRASNTR